MNEDQEYWIGYYDINPDEIAEFEDAHCLQEYSQFAHDYNTM